VGGRYVVFNSNRLGKSSIWRMDSDGGNLRQLTSDAEDAAPSVSPDGRWVVYQSAAEGKVVLKRVPLEGGAAELLTDRLAMRPAVSPDGATVACYHFNDSSKRWELGLLPMTAGLAAGPPKLIPLPPGAVNDIAARWSADGKSLFLVVTQDGVSNLWRQPVEGGAPKQVTDFKSQLIFSFDWSRDGRQLVCARGSIKSDAVLITGFRQAR
jgi:Tol biopolymer transport system component